LAKIKEESKILQYKVESLFDCKFRADLYKFL
jgi:hypothetical protein